LGAFEAQHTARAAVDAFTAGQAVRIGHVLSQPDMAADINADGAVECANTALHTARWLRNDVSAGKNFAPARFDWFFLSWHAYFSSKML
jgi:hypothetical protein